MSRAQHDPGRLPEALRMLGRARRVQRATPPASSLTLFEVGLRLASLEREVAEVRSRVNGVLFAVVASVLAQLATRVVAG